MREGEAGRGENRTAGVEASGGVGHNASAERARTTGLKHEKMASVSLSQFFYSSEYYEKSPFSCFGLLKTEFSLNPT